MVSELQAGQAGPGPARRPAKPAPACAIIAGMPRRRRPYRAIKRWSQIAWQPQPDGSSAATLQNDKAGEVLILIRRRSGHTAAAYGFLGILLWESQEQESVYRARRAARHWWQSVTEGTTRIHRPDPQADRHIARSSTA